MRRRVMNVVTPATEHEEQVALMKWWSLNQRRWPGVLLFAVPNGGHRGKATAANLRREGVLPGIPDLFLAGMRWVDKPGTGWAGGLWIELKRTSGSRTSVVQAQVHDILRRSGYEVVVARGWAEATKAIEAYLQPRATSTPREVA